MPAEQHKPGLRLTVEALRWTGEDFDRVGEDPALIDVHSDAVGNSDPEPDPASAAARSARERGER